MKVKQSSRNLQTYSKRNSYEFSISKTRKIQISSDFQNGNIILIKQVNQLYYVLEALCDIQNVNSKKTWFHFKVKAERGIKAKFVVQNVNIYDTIFQESLYCKPMMKEGKDGIWQQSTQSFFSYMDNLNVVIEHTFKNSEQVFFSLSVPFTYTDNEQYLEKIKASVDPRIFYEDQILAKTLYSNNVHLLTITEKKEEETKKKSFLVSEDLKPVIFITARVHPGEVSASYCLQGILQFLLSYDNLQAYLLRRLFVFKIVPMVNPDGIVDGNYRTDQQGFNLNRFYLEPNKQQHPAIYEIQQTLKKIAIKQKISYYFDLHSHSSIKESFIYGNAQDDLVSQTYSELFCSILQQNYPKFRYALSNFGEEHMKHKDKGENLTKQGCARVVVGKTHGVVCSYTMESSIFPTAYTYKNRNIHSNPKNKQFCLSRVNCEKYIFKDVYEKFDRKESVLVSQNKRLGASMMISILDMLQKNPYTRLKQDFISTFYKQISSKLLQNEERFKMMDIKAHQKSRMIQEYIKNKFDDVINREWNLVGLYQEINKIDWPDEFKKIIIINDLVLKVNNRNILKQKRLKTDKIEVSSSLKKSKEVQKLLTHQQRQEDSHFQAHRTISPNPSIHQKSIFPEIKYSIEMKGQNKNLLKSSSIKETHIKFNEKSIVKVPKKIIIDYINDEMNKIKPEKHVLKRTNTSLNRIIANKMIEKEKIKGRKSQAKQYQDIMVQSRKRIATQAEPEQDVEKEDLFESKSREKTLNDDQSIKVIDLRKIDLIKKKMLITNKAIQIYKKNDKGKIKLPQVNKVNLIISNSKNQLKLSKNKVDYEER